MGWADLLQTGDETLVAPWVGGRSVRSGVRTWKFFGRFPREHGWYRFKVSGSQKAEIDGSADPDPDSLKWRVRGYLVGDRVIRDDVFVDPNPEKILDVSEPVLLIENGLDRFVRVVAGRTHEDGPLVFVSQDMPIGPEADVLNAFLDRSSSVESIKGVTPALDAAFRMESWQRDEAEKRRIALEQLRREQAAKEVREAERRRLMDQVGTGQGRRALARQDFASAAKAALAVGDAEFLDDRPSHQRGEHVVRFRLDGRRFECVCDEDLHIVDSGICLRDSRTGFRGDTLFTLESLPAVIRQAEREHVLHVFRHVDDDHGGDDEWED